MSDLSVGDCLVLTVVHKLVVEVVAASDDLDFVHVVRVDGGKAHTAVVHLAGEHFVSEEIVAEESRVAVSHVVALCHCHVNKISEKGVHRVVLLVSSVEVLSVLLDVVAVEDVLQEEEPVVVSLVEGRSIIEDTNV